MQHLLLHFDQILYRVQRDCRRGYKKLVTPAVGTVTILHFDFDSPTKMTTTRSATKAQANGRPCGPNCEQLQPLLYKGHPSQSDAQQVNAHRGSRPNCETRQRRQALRSAQGPLVEKPWTGSGQCRHHRQYRLSFSMPRKQHPLPHVNWGTSLQPQQPLVTAAAAPLVRKRRRIMPSVRNWVHAKASRIRVTA